MTRPMKRYALIALAAGCGGAPAKPASPVAATGACPTTPADGTPPPLFEKAIGTPGGDMFVELVAATKADGPVPAAGRWIVWDAGGVGAPVRDADALAGHLAAVTGQAAHPAPAKDGVLAAFAGWDEGPVAHALRMEAVANDPDLGGTYACRVSPSTGPFRLADARAALPVFAPADLLPLVAEALADVPLARASARAGEASGGEVRYEVVADAAWKQALEEKLKAAADGQLEFQTQGVPGVAYTHDEPQWKVDVHDLPGGRVHVEIDWFPSGD